MTNGRSFDTERLLSNLVEILSALTISGLLPQAVPEDKRPTNEHGHQDRCIETCASEQLHQQDAESMNMEMNRFENIYASRDATQIISSTGGVLIHAKNISAGRGSLQCVGPMSDQSLRTVSRNHQPV